MARNDRSWWLGALAGAAAGAVAGIFLADEQNRKKVVKTAKSLSDQADRVEELREAIPHQIRGIRRSSQGRKKRA